MRSGTENTIGIAGFGAAAEYESKALSSSLDGFASLREYAEKLISEKLPDVRINVPSGRFAPHIMSLTLPGVRSETMLHYLSGKGYYVSSGSACSSHGKGGSYVLRAFGLSDKESDTSIRISLNPNITIEDLDAFLLVLCEGIATLVRIH